MAPTIAELRELLPDEHMVLAARAASREDAIRQVGELLVGTGAVHSAYVDQMLERESVVSTFVGDGVAMPHGTLGAKDDVVREALGVLVLENPIDWAGQPVMLVIGIAAHGRRYITLLSQLAANLLDDGRVGELSAAATKDRVRELLAG
jgi:mannitol PTS system EIIA component